MDEWTERRIKDTAKVKDVVADFISLRRAGTEWTCQCPFHDDRHAGNFKINVRKNMWFCFVCNEGGDAVSFLQKYKGMTYVEALTWLAQKYGISVDDDGGKAAAKAAAPPPTPKPKEEPKLAPLSLPLWMPQGYMERNGDDVLCKWLRGLPWNDDQRSRVDRVLTAYFVGRSKDGYTMFWQIDEKGYVRTAKMMRYLPDGHRDKMSRTTWYHAMLNRRPLPTKQGQVIFFDDRKQERVPTLFGMHLLSACPDATVNIVESEKTAIICTIAYGHIRQHLWMATGGKSSLNAERLAPIIARKMPIVLYPDKDGIEEWKRIAADIREETGYNAVSVADKFLLKNWRPIDGEKADLADILVRILTIPETADQRANKTQHVSAVVKEMVSINPNLQTLIDTFDLQEY